MAHFFRLIAMALLLGCCSAHALVPKTTQYYATNGGAIISASRGFSTYAAACDDGRAWIAGINKTRAYRTASTAPTCRVEEQLSPPNGAWTVSGIGVTSRADSCPANSTSVSGGCSCNSPYVEDSTKTACVPAPPVCTSKAGTTYTPSSSKTYQGGSSDSVPSAAADAMQKTPPSCAGGCATAPKGAPVLSQVNVNADGSSGVGGGAFRSWAGYSGGAWTVNFPEVVYTGGDCTASDNDLAMEQNWHDQIDQANAAPSPAPPGKCPGQVNGTTVYVPCSSVATASGGSSSSTGTSVSTGGSSGSTNGSGSGGSGGTNGNGSGTGATIIGGSGASNSSDTSITVCNSTTCTTTTRSTSTSATGGTASGGTGGTGGTSGNGTKDCAKAAASGASAPAGNTGVTCTETNSTTKSITDYCKENPKATQCVGTQSSFGGNCAAGFKAQSDDAVVNAMAEETFRQNCKLNPADSETTLAASERTKTGDQTKDNPNNTSMAVSPSSIDTSDALGGGGSCISDKTITVFGGVSVSLPMSKYCDGFALVGNLLVALSFLVAGVIVLRG